MAKLSRNAFFGILNANKDSITKDSTVLIMFSTSPGILKEVLFVNTPNKPNHFLSRHTESRGIAKKMLPVYSAWLEEWRTAQSDKDVSDIDRCIAALPIEDSERHTYAPIRDEWPLYSESSAADCPHSYYVGGLAVFNCACDNHDVCQGVRRTKLNMKGVEISRREYMLNLDRENSHFDYYSQFVTSEEIITVAQRIGVDKILQSQDEHFNDISLSLWDCVPISGRSAWMVSVSNTFTQTPGSRPSISLSDKVSINKTAAEIIRNTLLGGEQ